MEVDLGRGDSWCGEFEGLEGRSLASGIAWDLALGFNLP